jgi:UDP-N-acetylglucosamine--N-acetylmuramyl-(pentapeptide) pyrophosphoryl-undecaprenol N-acetylglucosamine transferase
MRVIIAGGGTGGHVFPGLAIAEEMKRRDDSIDVIFVGTEHGIEAKVVPREGYPLRYVRAEGIVGVSIARKIKALVSLFLSFIDSFRIIKTIKPDVVIGTGGYASGTVVLMAVLKSIPTIILEQNTIPGMTNKILGRFVDSICITYQDSMTYFPRGKTFLTGNPVRNQVLRGSIESAYKLFSLEKDLFTILVFGGSSGARSINRAIVDSLPYLYDIREGIQFLHQTGQMDYEFVRHEYIKHGIKGTIAPFIFQMGEAYAVADIVISRAGATTLAEITALGKPSILIPYPYATGGHQEFNARKLVEMNAARMLLDNELSGESISREIKEMYSDESLRNEMKKNSKIIGRPDATEKIVDIVFSLTKQSILKTQKVGFYTNV